MRTWARQRSLIHAAVCCTLLLGGAACGDDDEPLEGDDAGSGGGGRGGTGGSRAGSGGVGGRAGAGGNRAGTGGGGTGGTRAGTGGSEDDTDAGVSQSTEGEAADLRVTLNLLLSEHLVVAAKATGAALGGRTDEYAAYGERLTTNGEEIADLVGAAFGDTAKTAFDAQWKAHNGYFVAYTQAVADEDEEAQATAVSNLTDVYVPEFAKLLAGPTKLPEATLKSLTMEHVLTTKAIVDAQAAAQTSKEWGPTYTAIREAFEHMAMLGNPLAIAIAGQKPELFPGPIDTDAVAFRTALNLGLQEHLYLATFATGAALGGRAEEVTAAAAALEANGKGLGTVIGGLYDAAAETRFNELWEAHNDYFFAYTTGVAEDDTDAKAAAVTDLTTKYVPDFAEFLADATKIPETALTGLIASHVTTTKAVVDAQAGTNWTATVEADRTAGHHMTELGDPLAKAIVALKPDKF